MSDTAPRNPVSAPQLLADALLRSVSGATALLRITGATSDSSQAEVGILATAFLSAVLSPVVLRKLRPSWKEGEPAQWELLVSATSVQQQIAALDIPSAQALFAMTLAITIAEQDYLISAISSNEAFGQVYLYRLLLREARQQAV